MPDFGKIEPKFSYDTDLTSVAAEEAEFAQLEIAPPRPKINKKRAVMLLLFLAIIIAAVAFLVLQSKPTPTLQPQTTQPITFIDDNEPQNKLLKENAEAKNANVNVFDFDINKCLQQYSDEQCIDMYEKNLLITEKE